MAAAYIGDVACEIAHQCLQVHGGTGYAWEHDLHLFLRRVRSNAALYGESAWHRERVCAFHQLAGKGLSTDHQKAWNEESSGYAVPAPGGVASHVTLGVILPTLLAHASEQQKRDWIPRMLSGEEIWAQLLSEPGAGSDLAGIQTRAVRDGENWVLTGSKIWSSGAMSADYGICLARTDWDVPKHRGLTWFKVPLHDDRVTVRPVREINGSAEFCEEFLDGVTVDGSMAIGEVNGGWPIAGTMLAIERGGGSGQSAAALTLPGPRRLAPDLVELAAARGLTGDPAVRQVIARAHINDYMQAQLTRRLAAAMTAGAADPTAAWILGLPREPSADSGKPFREVLRDAARWGAKS
jgi:alkylation response protein AidB-like acyl-CoA dehydrogenase